MRRTRPMFRITALALAAVVLTTSGCSWFGMGKKDVFAQSPESRPLEVPPDLDKPNIDSAVKMPAGGSSVTRSTMAPTPAAADSASGFTIPGARDATFAKVGKALGAIDGVSIANTAPLLGTYDVDFQGSKFLVRVTEVNAGAAVYISAVDPRGVPATGVAPTQLIASLRTALGG